MLRMLKATALILASFLAVAQAHAHFFVCTAQSASPRGRGLIITEVLESRSATGQALATSIFRSWLRAQYAPYGNGWIFSDESVTCLEFSERNMADAQRTKMIGAVQRPTENVYHVPFWLN